MCHNNIILIIWDSGHAIYLGFIYMEALHNNHIAHVFVDLVCAVAKKRRLCALRNPVVHVNCEGQMQTSVCLLN